MGSYQSRMYTVYIYKYIYQAIVEDKESYEYAYMHVCCLQKEPQIWEDCYTVPTYTHYSDLSGCQFLEKHPCSGPTKVWSSGGFKPWNFTIVRNLIFKMSIQTVEIRSSFPSQNMDVCKTFRCQRTENMGKQVCRSELKWFEPASGSGFEFYITQKLTTQLLDNSFKNCQSWKINLNSQTFNKQNEVFVHRCLWQFLYKWSDTDPHNLDSCGSWSYTVQYRMVWRL